MDMQNLDYIKAKDAPPPLVGLPIGAGPEAPEHMEHIGNYEDCRLHPRNKTKISHQALSTRQAAQDHEAATVQQGKKHERVGKTIDSQVVSGLLYTANDTQHSRLVRLTHKKSASAVYSRLPWDESLPSDHTGSGFAHAAPSNNGTGSGEK